MTTSSQRLLTNTSKRSHITPVLRSLHCLPVRFRVEYKVLLFMFKAINGLAPVYLADLVTVYQPPRTLRSSEHTSLVTPKFKYKKFGGRSFAVQGPKLWNALPAHVFFKSQLKHIYSDKLLTRSLRLDCYFYVHLCFYILLSIDVLLESALCTFWLL